MFWTEKYSFQGPRRGFDIGGARAGGATMVGAEAEISKICSSRLLENAFQEHLVQFWHLLIYQKSEVSWTWTWLKNRNTMQEKKVLN